MPSSGSAAAGFQAPTVTFDSIGVSPLSPKGLTLTPVFRVSNPNAIGFRLTALTYQLDLEGQRALTGDEVEGIDVHSNGSALVPVPLRLRLADLPGLVLAVLGKSALSYTVKGAIGMETPIGALTVPFQRSDVIRLAGD